MYVVEEHLRVLDSLDESSSLEELVKLSSVNRMHLIKRVMELHIMGLVERKGDVVRLTEAGRLLRDAFREAGIKVSDPWVNSSIIYALELTRETEYVPDEWRELLSSRGFIKDGGLSDVASKVLQAYSLARPLIYLTPEISEFIQGLPSGPAFYDDLVAFRDALGYGNNVIHALEASRLLRISPPIKGKATYVVTDVGRKIKEAIKEMPIYSSVLLIDEEVVNALTSKELDTFKEHQYESMHLREAGSITEVGRRLVEGFNLQVRRAKKILPVQLTLNELSLLKAVKELYDKNPESAVESMLREASGVGETIGEILHFLEAVGLVKRIEIKSKDAYTLTTEGEEVVKRLGNADTDILSPAVKACTYALAGYPPSPEWVILGREEGLISSEITSRGDFIIDLSTRLIRTPFLTIYDSLLLHKTPAKGMRLKDAVKAVADELGEEDDIVMKYLGYAEFKGLVEVIPNDYIILTNAGRLAKDMISLGKTEEIIKMRVSITPTLYKVLTVIKDNLTELKKVWAKGDIKRVVVEETTIIYNNLKGLTSISVEEVKKTVNALRGLGLLGRVGVTEAGEKLLQLGELLENERRNLREEYFK